MEESAGDATTSVAGEAPAVKTVPTKKAPAKKKAATKKTAKKKVATKKLLPRLMTLDRKNSFYPSYIETEVS